METQGKTSIGKSSLLTNTTRNARDEMKDKVYSKKMGYWEDKARRNKKASGLRLWFVATLMAVTTALSVIEITGSDTVSSVFSGGTIVLMYIFLISSLLNELNYILNKEVMDEPRERDG